MPCPCKRLNAWLRRTGTKNFNTTAPANYVAGLGRGATGFTTRSDIGPARMGADQEGKTETNLNDSNFDRFSGYTDNLFGDMPYDDDDEAADLVWGEIDMKMDERRKSRREARIEASLDKYRAVRPKLQHQFSDLKRDLSYVTYEEWDMLPEPGEHRKHRAAEKRNERFFTPMPDSLLEKARMENDTHTSLDAKQMVNPTGGMQTPMSGGATPLTDLKSIGEARGAVLSVKLDQMSDSVTGQTVVDPKGYLTDLNSIKISTEAEVCLFPATFLACFARPRWQAADHFRRSLACRKSRSPHHTQVGDIKKARLLLKSVTSTNPGHGPGWIAAARLEEVAGKLVNARQVIREGCVACPANEDVWLEAARLQTSENAKAVLAEAVKKIPHSVKIWLQVRNEEPACRQHAMAQLDWWHRR